MRCIVKGGGHFWCNYARKPTNPTYMTLFFSCHGGKRRGGRGGCLSACCSASAGAQTEAKRDHLLNVLLEYLERYYVLIAFTEYVSGKQFAPKTPRHKARPDESAPCPLVGPSVLGAPLRGSAAGARRPSWRGTRSGRSCRASWTACCGATRLLRWG